MEVKKSKNSALEWHQYVLPSDYPVERASFPALCAGEQTLSLDEMTKEEFDAKMARGLAQAQAGEGVPADEFFAS